MPTPAQNIRIAGRKARKYDINPRYFKRQIRQESGGQSHVGSPAGAQGVAQIMPATARAWGVNPNHPREALDAAARHMAEYLRTYHGSWKKALTAYNAGPGRVGGPLPTETKNYISTILGGASGKQSTPSGGGGGGAASFSVDLGHKSQFDAQGFKRAQGGFVVGQLIAKNRGTDSPLFKSGLLTTTAPNRRDFMSQMLTSKIKKTGGGGGGGGGATGARGNVKLAGGADRAGVKTKPRVIRFAEKVAGVYGRSLTIGTGTNHSQMTTSGNVSDHWSGHAADIPASGKELTRLGRSALIAAGMSPRKARQAKGGIYNVNGHQIIFNTTQGGNHWNHLHISA